jgi:hypothetical protein
VPSSPSAASDPCMRITELMLSEPSEQPNCPLLSPQEKTPQEIYDELSGLPNIKIKEVISDGTQEYNELLSMSASMKLFNVGGYKVKVVFRVENALQLELFKMQSKSIAAKNNNNPCITTALHCTSYKECVKFIKNNYSDIMCPINRPFGNGVYFTKDFSTANYYSPDRGNPNAQRFLLVCEIILGNIYKYGKHPDTQLEQANGSVVYHSARGFKWGDYEYIIYNQNQIRPKYLICYNFINTNHEIQIYASLLNPINPMMFVPANPANFSSFTVNHSITGIIISRTFNEFLKTLTRLANIRNKTQEILKLITKLLFIQNINNVPIFMQEVMHLL